ncbi:MAG: hypothetical protein WBG20_05480, partial [Candidatus Deferrimicrobiaceae bacterium]
GTPARQRHPVLLGKEGWMILLRSRDMSPSGSFGGHAFLRFARRTQDGNVGVSGTGCNRRERSGR